MSQLGHARRVPQASAPVAAIPAADLYRLAAATVYGSSPSATSANVWCAMSITPASWRRSAMASPVIAPCRYRPLAFPFGAPPRAPWNLHTLQPVTAGARHRHPDRLLVAEQRADAFINVTCL